MLNEIMIFGGRKELLKAVKWKKQHFIFGLLLKLNVKKKMGENHFKVANFMRKYNSE